MQIFVMPFSLGMRSDGLVYRKDLCWATPYLSSRVALGLIDGTFIKIRKPWNNDTHKT
jgi:hypothetical protein